MEANENPKLHDLVNSLRDSFAPIHAAWLAQSKQSGNPADMLRDDVIALGLFISTHHKVGAPLEKKLLAELLSFLTPSLSQMPYEYALAALDDQIEKLSASYVTKEEWPDFAAISMAKSWAGEDTRRKQQVQLLVSLFSQLANQFVLSDGKVTDEEIRFLNAFDQHFSIA